MLLIAFNMRLLSAGRTIYQLISQVIEKTKHGTFVNVLLKIQLSNCFTTLMETELFKISQLYKCILVDLEPVHEQGISY